MARPRLPRSGVLNRSAALIALVRGADNPILGNPDSSGILVFIGILPFDFCKFAQDASPSVLVTLADLIEVAAPAATARVFATTAFTPLAANTAGAATTAAAPLATFGNPGIRNR